MIAFDSFVLEDGTPIYLQIITFLKRGLAAGSITDGDELPSRRMLSALLGVNPNTVQKAYHLLEEEGLIQSRSGAKSTLVADPNTVARLRQELLAVDARNIVSTMKQLGLSKEEALRLLDTYWE